MFVTLKKALPYIIICMGVFLFLSIRSCNNNKQQLDELREMVKALSDTTKHWKNKYGEEVASRKAVEGSLANMKNFFTKEEVKEMERRFDTEFKNLKSLIKISSSGQTTIPPVTKPEIVYVDSSGPCPQVTAMAQKFENPYYSLDVRVGRDAYARLLAFDTTTIVTKRAFKRRFLSKQWYTQVDAISANDSIRNTVQGAFIIRDTYQKNYLEIYGAIDYKHFQPVSGASGLYGGVGGAYNLGRIYLTGSYQRAIGGGGGSLIQGGVRISVLRL